VEKMEEKMAGSRADWSSRILRFTDMMLERLSESWQEKDVDEKETRALGNMIVKMVRLWDKALSTPQREPRSPTSSSPLTDERSEVESGKE
jgi:hypothetical protein